MNLIETTYRTFLIGASKINFCILKFNIDISDRGKPTSAFSIKYNRFSKFSPLFLTLISFSCSWYNSASSVFFWISDVYPEKIKNVFF